MCSVVWSSAMDSINHIRSRQYSEHDDHLGLFALYKVLYANVRLGVCKNGQFINTVDRYFYAY